MGLAHSKLLSTHFQRAYASPSPPATSYLRVNVRDGDELNLALCTEIIISWHICASDVVAVAATPSIGLFRRSMRILLARFGSFTFAHFVSIKEEPESDNGPSECLEMRELTGSSRLVGQLSWPTSSLLASLSRANAVSSALQSVFIEFRYYNAAPLHHPEYKPPHLIACTPPIRVTSAVAIVGPVPSVDVALSAGNVTSSSEHTLTLRISDIRAAQLRKGVFFNPDSYVKLTTHSSNGVERHQRGATSHRNSHPTRRQRHHHSSRFYHHNQYNAVASAFSASFKTSVASNTCFPHWRGEVTANSCSLLCASL